MRIETSFTLYAWALPISFEMWGSHFNEKEALDGNFTIKILCFDIDFIFENYQTNKP